MTIHDKLLEDAKLALKNGDKITLDNLKFILGEFSRLKGTKDGKKYIGSKLTDEQACKVLNNILAGEEKLAELTKQPLNPLYNLVKSYLPKKLTDDEIMEYLNNFDFSSVKNKMQVIGIMKKKFGVKLDANRVKELLENF